MASISDKFTFGWKSQFWDVTELIDKETGVHYLVFEDKYYDKTSITPRYDSNGQIMCDKRRK